MLKIIHTTRGHKKEGNYFLLWQNCHTWVEVGGGVSPKPLPLCVLVQVKALGSHAPVLLVLPLSLNCINDTNVQSNLFHSTQSHKYLRILYALTRKTTQNALEWHHSHMSTSASSHTTFSATLVPLPRGIPRDPLEGLSPQYRIRPSAAVRLLILVTQRSAIMNPAG